MNIPIEELINKYGSKKSLSAIVAIAAIVALPIAETLEPMIMAVVLELFSRHRLSSMDCQSTM